MRFTEKVAVLGMLLPGFVLLLSGILVYLAQGIFYLSDNPEFNPGVTLLSTTFIVVSLFLITIGGFILKDLDTQFD